MSRINHKDTKFNPVETTLKSRQTQLNLRQYFKQTECRNVTEHDQVQEAHKDVNTTERSVKIVQEGVVSRVPDFAVMPETRKVAASEFNKVIIDLETSSRGDDAEICQIAATDGSGEFNIYIFPKRGITSGASAVNKLRVKRGCLYQDKKKVTALSRHQGLTRFMTWLKFKTPCLLIAHNAKSFDAKHLLSAMASCNETCEFSQKVLGFSDTLTIFRELQPDRKSFSQINLAKDLLGVTYNAHNALDDVRMLQKLVSKFISDELLIKHSFTVSSFRDYLAYARKTQENLKSLGSMVEAGRITRATAEKIAGSGLGMRHMDDVFHAGGVKSLCDVLTQLHRGKPRVTSNKKIIENICSFYEEKANESNKSSDRQ